MAIYYYATDPDAADRIVREGFRDPAGAQWFEGAWLSGVILCDWPRRALGDHVLQVEVPASCDLSAYAIVEAGSVSEWCVPAARLNACAAVRLLTSDEIDEVLTRWSFVRRSRGS
jgi:hypothetical protein